MWLLLNKYYPLYQEKQLDKLTPESITNYTKKYERAAEPYLQFCDENITFNEDVEIMVDELRKSYIEWYQNSIGGKPVKPGGIIDYFISKGCVKKGKIIKGINYNDSLNLMLGQKNIELD
jgi:hypothetical protein